MVSIFNSTFSNIKANKIIVVRLSHVISFNWKPNTILILQNTTFSAIRAATAVITTVGTALILKGTVIFTKIVSGKIILPINSQIQLEGHIQFSCNHVIYCLAANYIIMEENTQLDIIANNFSMFVFTISEYGNSFHGIDDIRCSFQYSKNQKNYMISKNNSYMQMQHNKYSIFVKDNVGYVMFNKKFATSHCDWIDVSVYKHSDSHRVNNNIIQYINNSLKTIKANKTICYCRDNHNYSCEIDEIGPVYPGQTYAISLIIRNTLKIEPVLTVSIESGPTRACKTHTINNHFTLFQNTWTKIDHNILYDKNSKTCELYFQGASIISSPKLMNIKSNWQFLDAHSIKLLPCPIGFEFVETTQMCQCDTVLKKVIDSCNNINKQTVARPANTWIVGSTNSKSIHTYLVSLQCPFDYCLPYASQLNLSNPDTQCQFIRTGLQCGKCKEGLSAVFGTSQCKHCTDYYLLLRTSTFHFSRNHCNRVSFHFQFHSC